MSTAAMIRKCVDAVRKNPKNKNAASFLSAFTNAEIENALDAATGPRPGPRPGPRKGPVIPDWLHHCGWCKSMQPVCSDGRNLFCAKCGKW